MNTIKLNVIGEVVSAKGGSGGESAVDIDLSPIKYNADDAKSAQDRINGEIAYSKTLYDAWDASRTSAEDLYKDNGKLIYAPNIDTSQVTNMNGMFVNCTELEVVPKLDTKNVTNMGSMFSGCSSLISIPQFDTSNATDMFEMFSGCDSLVTVPQLDTTKVTDMTYIFSSCVALENLGGFINCRCSLDLSKSTKLTHQSLMNVINNLLDLTRNGLSGKTLNIGSTNLAKLTADEIAIGTNKGWTIK